MCIAVLQTASGIQYTVHILRQKESESPHTNRPCQDGGCNGVRVGPDFFLQSMYIVQSAPAVTSSAFMQRFRLFLAQYNC